MDKMRKKIFFDHLKISQMAFFSVKHASCLIMEKIKNSGILLICCCEKWCSNQGDERRKNEKEGHISKKLDTTLVPPKSTLRTAKKQS